MYVGIFKITSDRETAVLRVDLSADATNATYQLQDSLGDCHAWTVNLSTDSYSKTFFDRACMAVLSYLQDCTSNGWNGEITLVQSGIGIASATWHELFNSFRFHSPTVRPEGVALQ